MKVHYMKVDERSPQIFRKVHDSSKVCQFNMKNGKGGMGGKGGMDGKSEMGGKIGNGRILDMYEND